MTIATKVLVDSKYMEASQQDQVTPTVQTFIDTFSVTNISTATANFSVNITAINDTVDNKNKIIDQKSVRSGETIIVSEVIGNVLETGNKLSTIASSGSALVMRICGREIT